MDIVRIFINETGEYGNTHQVIFDEDKKLTVAERQSIAYKSGLSEIVFINNKTLGDISIYNPLAECPFAGSALLAACFVLKPLDYIVSNDFKIPTWQEGAATYVRMNKLVLPKWNYEQLSTPAEVEKLTLVDTKSKEHMFIWAWIDAAQGLVRARTFATDWGIPEDPANGSGSMRLADSLKREVTVIHGLGSIVHARPAENDFIEVGGLVSSSPAVLF